MEQSMSCAEAARLGGLKRARVLTADRRREIARQAQKQSVIARLKNRVGPEASGEARRPQKAAPGVRESAGVRRVQTPFGVNAALQIPLIDAHAFRINP